MKIDVIIPVYKPDRGLFVLLDKLKDQTVPVQNVILMNTEKKYFLKLVHGTDFTERYPNVKVYHLSRREFDHGGTRHLGVMHSDADVFVVMTQDAIPVDDDLIRNLTEGLTDKAAVSYARQLPAADADEWERISRYFNYPAVSCVKTAADRKALGIKTFFCSNVCAAYRRDIYDELGGFIRHTIFNEDMIYAAGAVQAGYSIVYQAGARVIHSHNYTNMQQLRRNFDLGVSQAEHPEVFRSVSSESEGGRLMRTAWRYLKKRRRLYKFPAFLVQCCFKYAGFVLGKNYRRLPRKWVLGITSNIEYWNQEG